MMSLDDIGRLLAMERDSEALQPLPGTFRVEVKSYLDRLLASMRTASDYREVDMLRDEERNARILLEGLEDRRLGKVLAMATIYAGGARSMDLGALQGEDRQAFDLLASAVVQAKQLLKMGV